MKIIIGLGIAFIVIVIFFIFLGWGHYNLSRFSILFFKKPYDKFNSNLSFSFAFLVSSLIPCSIYISLQDTSSGNEAFKMTSFVWAGYFLVNLISTLAYIIARMISTKILPLLAKK